MARACKLPYLLLCSTDDPDVKATWRALGFLFTSEEVQLDLPWLQAIPTSDDVPSQLPCRCAPADRISLLIDTAHGLMCAAFLQASHV